jgi:NAD-dependent deacetylase
VTFFGEMLPEEDFGAAQLAIGKAEVLVVVGSSLVVYPAAGLPMMRRRSCRYVIVNRDPTDQDRSAQLVIHAGAGDVLRAAMATEQ